MYPLLVADIGGTNARFGLVFEDEPLVVSAQNNLSCLGFSSFKEALHEYLSGVSVKCPQYAVIAVAGPIDGGHSKMTNLDWSLSVEDLENHFGFSTVLLVNDLAAQILATTSIDSKDLKVLKHGDEVISATKAIVGPGTGLGIASMNWSGSNWTANAGEGGHIAFAPGNDIEKEIHGILLKENPYVSLEMFLSGPGLINIYRSLAKISGELYQEIAPKVILECAANNEGEIFKKTAEVFLAVLGGAVGDVALVFGAKGGVYLGGGLTKHLIPFIEASDFSRRFNQFEVRKKYLDSIPVYAITHDNPGLLGAAIFYQHHLQK